MSKSRSKARRKQQAKKEQSTSLQQEPQSLSNKADKAPRGVTRDDSSLPATLLFAAAALLAAISTILGLYSAGQTPGVAYLLRSLLVPLIPFAAMVVVLAIGRRGPILFVGLATEVAFSLTDFMGVLNQVILATYVRPDMVPTMTVSLARTTLLGVAACWMLFMCYRSNDAAASGGRFDSQRRHGPAYLVFLAAIITLANALFAILAGTVEVSVDATLIVRLILNAASTVCIGAGYLNLADWAIGDWSSRR